MARNPGDHRLEHADVCGKHPASHRREAGRHDRGELRHRHLRYEGRDHQGRLGHSDERVRRRGKRFGPRGLHRSAHDPREASNDPLHQAKVVEHRRERGEEDQCRQDVDCNSERLGRIVAKDERRPLCGEPKQREDEIVQHREEPSPASVFITRSPNANCRPRPQPTILQGTRSRCFENIHAMATIAKGPTSDISRCKMVASIEAELTRYS